jgi:hypothetical protein
MTWSIGPECIKFDRRPQTFASWNQVAIWLRRIDRLLAPIEGAGERQLSGS